jgi:acetolactate synthase small subunit
MTDTAQIFARLVEDAPGSLMDVVGTFAYRGVSLEFVLGFGRPLARSGLVVFVVRCSEKRAHDLERVVRRLPVVTAVYRLAAETAPLHRTVLVERLQSGGSVDSAGVHLLELTEQWALITGPEPAVRQFLRGGIDGGKLGEHAEVLVA